MPTGMNPMARPWRARPASIGASELDIAQMTEPRSRSAALTTRTRCLPTRSATRPATGIATAAASRVMVTTHEAFEAEVASSWGSSLWMGITIVWVSAAPRPPKHRTTTARSGWCAAGTDADMAAILEMIAFVNQFGWEPQQSNASAKATRAASGPGSSARLEQPAHLGAGPVDLELRPGDELGSHGPQLGVPVLAGHPVVVGRRLGVTRVEHGRAGAVGAADQGRCAGVLRVAPAEDEHGQHDAHDDDRHSGRRDVRRPRRGRAGAAAAAGTDCGERRGGTGAAWLARSRWPSNACCASAYAAAAWALLAVMWNSPHEHATSHRCRPIESAGGTWV